MSEHHSVIFDQNGVVVNVIVVPENDADLGPAWDDDVKAKKIRRITKAERDAGVGAGWKRAANGALIDERPKRPTPEPPASSDRKPPPAP